MLKIWSFSVEFEVKKGSSCDGFNLKILYQIYLNVEFNKQQHSIAFNIHDNLFVNLFCPFTFMEKFDEKLILMLCVSEC